MNDAPPSDLFATNLFLFLTTYVARNPCSQARLEWAEMWLPGGAQIQQSGTYNANPLSMVAGMATLQQLTPEVYARLDTLTKRLGAELDAVFEEAGISAQVTTVGSLFRVHFLPQRPRNDREAARDNGRMHRWLQLRLLNHDIMWSTAGNVSAALGEVG